MSIIAKKTARKSPLSKKKAKKNNAGAQLNVNTIEVKKLDDMPIPLLTKFQAKPRIK